MSEILDVALRIEIERLSVTSSKPVNHGAIPRKEFEHGAPNSLSPIHANN
jgi:hypothetical protein